MRILCTYCSGPKRVGKRPLPAVRRYRSARITALAREARARGGAWQLRILSGHYGLLAPDDLIPWYDHLLLEDEVAALVPAVAQRLADDGATSVEYHTAAPEVAPAIAPYLAVITQACARVGVTLDVVTLPGDPD